MVDVKRILILIVLAGLFVGMLITAAGANDHVTGLERAAQATLQGLEKSQGKSADAPGQENRARGQSNKGDKLTGRERAAAVIAAAMERGNGNGNAHGRGNAARIHEILASGDIPGQIDEQNHGRAVRDMVHSFNELRKANNGS